MLAIAGSCSCSTRAAAAAARHLLAAAAAAAAPWQPRRSTVVVARNHELDRPYPELDRRPLHEVDDYPDRVPVYSNIYHTVDVLAMRPDSEQLLRVRLSRDVPGLGESGQLVAVHRSRYWHYLYPLGWAVIHTGAAAASDSTAGGIGSEDWRNSRVFTGPQFRLQRTLEAMQLLVPVNRDANPADFRLSERHICVAFRRYGLEIPRRAIRLPERPPTLASARRGFKVGVQLNSQVTVSVKSALHLVALGHAGSGLPPAQLPQVEVDDWLSEMHPMPELPKYGRIFEDYMMQQGPPDFEQILGSNRSRVKKK